MTISGFESTESLPIAQQREAILRSVDTNQVTIITAETGAGKSTQVPQYLAEHGYKKIIVTQPRILAARNLCMRVRQEYSWRTGHDATKQVGYRTAHERDDFDETVILYCTDGLQLVRELTGSGITERQILVLDEIHEWNENMEVLIAWAKKRCQQDSNFRVVLMSATIETATLAAYFDAGEPIAVEGRTYGVSMSHGEDILTEIVREIDSGRPTNMLVFLPGKGEIEAISEALEGKAQGHGIPVLPLHSQLELHEQQKVFASYPKGKIILTTNVAQTSITIDDIDMVIDSGLERRTEVRSGVEGLFIAETSQADCLQRAGRSGRTRPGRYVLAQLELLPCSKLEERDEYGVPEIMRKHIDRLVLRLANIGIDIETLEFYHAPKMKTIRLAKRTLQSLGALTSGGSVTEIGRHMERFPVESSYARMLVEAERYSSSVQSRLATIIAIQEIGGIIKGSTRYTGWRKYTTQTRSDLLAQYDVYLALPDINPELYEDMGIIAKNIEKTEEVNERLNRDLGLGPVVLEPIAENDVEDLLHCIIAGQMDQIWIIEKPGEAIHISSGKRREPSGSSVVKHNGLIVGTPFDLEVSTPSGLETLHLVNDITAVEAQWLADIAPDVFRVQTGKVYFDSYRGTLATRILIQYNGQSFVAASSQIVEATHENRKLFVRLYALWIREHLENERKTLEHATSRTIPPISVKEVEERVRYFTDGAISLFEVPKRQRIELAKLTRLEAYMSKQELNALAKIEEKRQFRRRFRRHGSEQQQPRYKKHFRRRRD